MTWVCQHCGLTNFDSQNICSICLNTRSSNRWRCIFCESENSTSILYCECCNRHYQESEKLWKKMFEEHNKTQVSISSSSSATPLYITSYTYLTVNLLQPQAEGNSIITAITDYERKIDYCFWRIEKLPSISEKIRKKEIQNTYVTSEGKLPYRFPKPGTYKISVTVQFVSVSEDIHISANDEIEFSYRKSPKRSRKWDELG